MVQIIQSLDQHPIADLADKFVAGSQLGRQRKKDKLEQEDADWRKKKYEDESAKSDARYADTKAREQRDFEQRDRFHQDEQTWRTKRLEIDAQARASAAQDHAAEWRSLFNEDPPDEVYGDVGIGVLLPHIDPRSDVPVEIQQMIHEHVSNPRATAEDTRLLHQTAKQVALERAKGAVRRKIERWAQPDPEAGGGAGAGELRPEQILPGDRAKEWIKGLDDIKDPNDPKAFQNLDDINTKLEDFAKDQRTQVVNRNARDQAVLRMNTMLDKVSQRDLEDGMGSSIPQESLDEMHQILEGIAQSGLGGNALQAAEERFATKLRQARMGGAGGTTSAKKAQPFSDQHPSDQALEVWKGLEPGARTPEALDALELKYAQRAVMAQQNAQMNAGKRAAAQSLPYETDLSNSSATPNGSALPTGQAPDAGLPAAASALPPEKVSKLERLKDLRMKGLGLDGKPGKISLEDGVAFVDGAAKPQDEDLKAERARLSEGYVSEREAAKIKEIDKRLPERAKERAEAAANEGIDEQFLKSAIERLPSTEKQWIDDMQRVEDLAKGNDGYAKKAKRLYSKLKEHGESKGWSRGTD